MKRWIIALFIVMVIVPAARAEQATILTSDWPPFVDTGKKGYGFIPDIVSHAFIAAGVEPLYELMPWKRIAKEIQYGNAFGAIPYTPSDERKKFAVFSEPLFNSRNVLFFNKNHTAFFSFEKPEDLRGRTVAMQAGNYYENMLREAGVEVDVSTSLDSSFKKLKLGRVDLVAENELVGWSQLRTLYPNDMHRFGSSVNALVENELYVMASKKHPRTRELLAAFNKGLAIIKENGVYDDILNKYNISR